MSVLVSVDASGSVIGGGEPSEARVWPPGVVFVPPVFDDDSGFGERSELVDVQQFVAGPTVERLDPGVLPG